MSDEELEFSEWENDDEKFALRVPDNAMADDHILEGDFAVFQRASTAKNGQIVAFRHTDGTVLIRRARRPRHGPGLIFVSPRPCEFPEIDDLDPLILGVLVGVVRKY